ncbi:MAG TPA: hypothetical protein ENK23_05045 [Sorangium sp.]|nr:hypothetical protein [Sorangium sp.]
MHVDPCGSAPPPHATPLNVNMPLSQVRRRIFAVLPVAAVLALACGGSGGCRDAPSAAGHSAAGVSSGARPSPLRVAVTVTAKGFVPNEVHLKQGQPGVLAFTRIADSECLSAVRMPWMSEATPLPKGKTVEIPVDTDVDGTFTYSCWMTMVFGRVVIDPK